VVGRAASVGVDLAVAVVDDDPDAAPREVKGERAAKPLAAAGDDGDPATLFARRLCVCRHEVVPHQVDCPSLDPLLVVV
jgi:hypothetical protein